MFRKRRWRSLSQGREIGERAFEGFTGYFEGKVPVMYLNIRLAASFIVQCIFCCWQCRSGRIADSEFYFQCVYSSLTYPLSVLSLIPSNLVFLYLPSKPFSHWPLMSGSAATALVGVLRTSRFHFYAGLIAVAHLHWAFMLRFVVHNCCAHDLLTMQVTVALTA